MVFTEAVDPILPVPDPLDNGGAEAEKKIEQQRELLFGGQYQQEQH